MKTRLRWLQISVHWSVHVDDTVYIMMLYARPVPTTVPQIAYGWIFFR